MSIANTEQSRNILAEVDAWQTIQAQPADSMLDVYLDLKSPHAYLAVRPSLHIAKDYRVRINFLPYTLSYETLGVTTSVEPDMQRRPPSEAADRKARMYYATARQYAQLQNLPFRTPYRLLDSHNAHKALLFAKQQQLELPFLLQVYVEGWGSGWRGYELESVDQLQATLQTIGAETAGFKAFLEDAGEQALRQCMDDAERSGVTGVPHYVFEDPASGRILGLFGREHLALIRGKLQEQGLARSKNVRPEFSHAWRGVTL